jgi:hypothetical protein
MDAAAWLSGHTTAIVSLLLALVIVPAALAAAAAALGGVFAAVALGSICAARLSLPERRARRDPRGRRVGRARVRAQR